MQCHRKSGVFSFSISYLTDFYFFFCSWTYSVPVGQRLATMQFNKYEHAALNLSSFELRSLPQPKMLREGQCLSVCSQSNSKVMTWFSWIIQKMLMIGLGKMITFGVAIWIQEFMMKQHVMIRGSEGLWSFDLSRVQAEQLISPIPL